MDQYLKVDQWKKKSEKNEEEKESEKNEEEEGIREEGRREEGRRVNQLASNVSSCFIIGGSSQW